MSDCPGCGYPVRMGRCMYVLCIWPVGPEEKEDKEFDPLDYTGAITAEERQRQQTLAAAETERQRQQAAAAAAAAAARWAASVPDTWLAQLLD